MIDLNIPIAFMAGVVSFFAPCVVPLLPAYVGYITGISLRNLKTDRKHKFRRKVLVSSIFYVLGFSLVFIALGTAAAGVGQVLRRHNLIIQRIGGILITIFGLDFAGYLNLPAFRIVPQFKLPTWLEKLGNLRAFVIGLIFALAWTPCVGVILGSILALAATTTTAARGAVLLFFYSLGISAPFLIVSLTISSASKYLKVVSKNLLPISKVAGIILAILGVLLLTDTYKFVNSWLVKLIY